jgi:hypothetical protein
VSSMQEPVVPQGYPLLALVRGANAQQYWAFVVGWRGMTPITVDPDTGNILMTTAHGFKLPGAE